MPLWDKLNHVLMQSTCHGQNEETSIKTNNVRGLSYHEPNQNQNTNAKPKRLFESRVYIWTFQDSMRMIICGWKPKVIATASVKLQMLQMNGFNYLDAIVSLLTTW
ncbi:predicted protein [Botrytis cinerea T4]|uniref:Uncharacterized protein n=1 Tax=Botryotinia fuckeliana (strain T4) TaxID=999810 RepID=G2XVE7_BOTF4|nr:predicted protein [Botrytis cinerea T4]